MRGEVSGLLAGRPDTEIGDVGEEHDRLSGLDRRRLSSRSDLDKAERVIVGEPAQKMLLLGDRDAQLRTPLGRLRQLHVDDVFELRLAYQQRQPSQVMSIRIKQVKAASTILVDLPFNSF